MVIVTVHSKPDKSHHFHNFEALRRKIRYDPTQNDAKLLNAGADASGAYTQG